MEKRVVPSRSSGGVDEGYEIDLRVTSWETILRTKEGKKEADGVAQPSAQ